MQLEGAEGRLGRLLDFTASRGGRSSGEIVVSTMESSVRRAGPSGNWWSATYLTRNFTSVLGIEQFGLYMLMWSPL